MKGKVRRFCPHCGSRIAKRLEEETLRDYCARCGTFFYENPLPVVSTIVVTERSLLLVKRGKRPYRGLWCPPTGFAESGESIEAAAVRELEEETGIVGKVTSLVDVDSCANRFYGDLLFITFEAEQVGGALKAGSDTVAVKYFPVDRIPKLAFSSNRKAVQAYVRSRTDTWAIVDSFARTIGKGGRRRDRGNLLSDRLFAMIEQNANSIGRRWVREVTSPASRTTAHFHGLDQARLRRRILLVISQLGKWLSGFYDERDMADFFAAIGRERRREGFRLRELLSALSLLKKHLWEFALSQGMWHRTLDMYAALELNRRVVAFFDRATFHITRGYEA